MAQMLHFYYKNDKEILEKIGKNFSLKTAGYEIV